MMNTTNNKWWEGLKPLCADGDGQMIWSIYARKVKTWEYAIVYTYDDGTFHEAIILSDGSYDLIED